MELKDVVDFFNNRSYRRLDKIMEQIMNSNDYIECDALVNLKHAFNHLTPTTENPLDWVVHFDDTCYNFLSFIVPVITCNPCNECSHVCELFEARKYYLYNSLIYCEHCVQNNHLSQFKELYFIKELSDFYDELFCERDFEIEYYSVI